MTSDELRALADALERMAQLERHGSPGALALESTVDYLRACADAKPVGVYVHRPAELRYGVEWLVGDPMPNGTQLFTHPAPVAPQAEPKREPLSDEQITKGEYVLATKFSDGDPGDHWGVGFYDRFENGRHYVVDSAGKQIRGNGFRRVGRITVEVGRWLLSAAKSLEASPPGTVNLWTMLTKRAHGIGGSDAE